MHRRGGYGCHYELWRSKIRLRGLETCERQVCCLLQPIISIVGSAMAGELNPTIEIMGYERSKTRLRRLETGEGRFVIIIARHL